MFLIANQIGVFCDPTSEWITLDRKGTVLTRQKLPLGNGPLLSRLGVTSSGRLIVAGGQPLSAVVRQWDSEKESFQERSESKTGMFLGIDAGRLVIGDVRIGEPTILRY